MGFRIQNHDLIKGQPWGDLRINFDLLEFFNVHPVHGTQEFLNSAPHQNAAAAAGIEPATTCPATIAVGHLQGNRQRKLHGGGREGRILLVVIWLDNLQISQNCTRSTYAFAHVVPITRVVYVHEICALR